jgi:hypothetical protein
VALGAVLAAKGGRRLAVLPAGDGAATRFDHRHGIPLGSVFLRAFRPVVAVAPAFPSPALQAVRSWPVIPRSFIPGPLIPGPIIPGPIIPGPIVPRPLIPRPVVPRSILTRALVPGTVVPISIFPGSLIPGSLIPGPVIPVSGSVAPSAPVAGFGLGFDRLDLKALARLVLKIDVKAGVELVAADDLGGGSIGLHGPDQAEIVLCVLQEVLGQDAVTGGTRVPRELLVLFVDDLGASANLDAFRPIGLHGPVGIVLLRLAYRAAIATALTLHALEISHVPPFRCPVSS